MNVNRFLVPYLPQLPGQVSSQVNKASEKVTSCNFFNFFLSVVYIIKVLQFSFDKLSRIDPFLLFISLFYYLKLFSNTRILMDKTKS